MSVKEEIKDEEFDDCLQEYLFASQKVEEKLELEHDCKTESENSPTLACKEEESTLMGIKEETESDFREYGHDDSSPTSKLQIILYDRTLVKSEYDIMLIWSEYEIMLIWSCKGTQRVSAYCNYLSLA